MSPMDNFNRMKQVVSVSLGSASGDFLREITLAGQRVRLAREGTDGDMDAGAPAN